VIPGWVWANMRGMTSRIAQARLSAWLGAGLLGWVLAVSGCSDEPDPTPTSKVRPGQCTDQHRPVAICGEPCTAVCGCRDCVDGTLSQVNGVTVICSGTCYVKASSTTGLPGRGGASGVGGAPAAAGAAGAGL
jgi:hypothetical protein